MLLVSYNIQYGVGRDRRYELARSIEVVAEADVIALQEVERNWRRTGMDDQPALIGEMLPDRHWIYGPELDVDASFHEALGRVVSRRRQHGQMILSRWPILSSRTFVLPKLDAGPELNMATGALEAVIDAPSGPLRVYSVHLGFVAPEERLLQAMALRDIILRAPAEGGVWSGADPDGEWQTDDAPPPMPAPAVLLGDFNAEPGAPEIAVLTGPPAGLVDAWRIANCNSSEGVTFRAAPGERVPHGMRIDYAFLSADLAPRVQRCWIDGTTEASDHQPVWVKLTPERRERDS